MPAARAMHRTNPKRVLVVGLGTTGFSCVRYLAARGYDVSVTDSRAAPPNLAELKREFPDVPVHTGGFAADWFIRAEMLVVSPGISLREPAIARALAAGCEAVGDIELFARAVQERTNVAGGRMPHRDVSMPRAQDAQERPPGATEAKAPVLAITGANGKSTVTSLVGDICRAAGLDTRVGGNIGVPALSLLGPEEPDVYVLELSSFQLETTTSLNARAATVLNLTPDHMDRYRNLDEYADAKARVFRGDGLMVLNADDARVLRMAQPNRRSARFTLGAPSSSVDYGLRDEGGRLSLVRGEERLLAASDVPLPGRHNLANVLAAIAITDALGVARDAQRRAVRAFKGLPHRTELVAEQEGVRWINDSKGTNVGATVAALNGMEAPVVLIAGGDGKGADFGELRDVCARRARAVVLIGRDAPRIEAALAGILPVRHAKDMQDAVRAARALARPGDVVLLSPACASFDMYKNYEHRGDVFRAAVAEMLR